MLPQPFLVFSKREQRQDQREAEHQQQRDGDKASQKNEVMLAPLWTDASHWFGMLYLKTFIMARP